MMLARQDSRDVVFLFAVVGWHFSWQSCQSIAKGLAQRGYAVHYVNPIPKRFPSLRETGRVVARLCRVSRAIGSADDSGSLGIAVWNPRCLPSIGPATRSLARLMLGPFVKQLHQFRSRYRRCIVMSALPFRLPHQVATSLAPDLLAYICHTHWQADPHAPMGELCEETVLRDADLVLTDSDLLYRRCRAHPGVRRFPATVDLELFQPVPRSSQDVASGRRLRCVYYGGISWRLDLSILAGVSRLYQLRLVGPVRTSLTDLAPETEIVGAVDHKELPQYVQDADVLLLPYARHELVRGVMPAKLFEYLATGLPIVATDALPTLSSYAQLLRIAKSREEFLRAIAEAPHEDSHLREERLALAQRHSVHVWMDRLASWLEDG